MGVFVCFWSVLWVFGAVRLLCWGFLGGFVFVVGSF